jgi:hypothetical protein
MMRRMRMMMMMMMMMMIGGTHTSAEIGLRGVGPFTFDYLDYTGDDTGSPVAVQQAKDM